MNDTPGGRRILAGPKLYFDRYTLQISRQKTFDPYGRIMSDLDYSNWKSYDRVGLPSDIDIKRPRENYQVQLNVISMKINPPNVTPERFVLEQPPGTQLEQLKKEIEPVVQYITNEIYCRYTAADTVVRSFWSGPNQAGQECS